MRGGEEREDDDDELRHQPLRDEPTGGSRCAELRAAERRDFAKHMTQNVSAMLVFCFC